MTYILVPILVVLVALVVISLVRGIVAFLNSTKLDLNDDDRAGATDMQMLQNKMMFARIKYQAAAVLVVAVLLAATRP
ncbi:MAG: hypothetical protein V4579_09320 [Pseudomonadota bacterium]